MKRYGISLALAFLLASCGEDGGLFVEMESELDVGDLAASATSSGGCLDTCDGDIESTPPVSLKGSNSDLVGLFYLVTGPTRSEDGFYVAEVIDELDAEGLLDDVDADGRRVAFTGRQTIECGDGNEETPGDGTFTVTVSGNAWLFENTGEIAISIDEPRTFVTTVSYANCLVEGNLLSDGTNNESLRLGGGFTYTEHSDAATITSASPRAPAGPYFSRATGTVTLTERDEDTGTGGLQDFWVTPLQLNAKSWYDGDNSFENGGACAGAGVAFGVDPPSDPESSDDDGCAPDADEGDEGFLSAGWVTE
ncbi:MAG: hypothetical protein AB1405_03240 [Bdellovibrionota bacterium]